MTDQIEQYEAIRRLQKAEQRMGVALVFGMDMRDATTVAPDLDASAQRWSGARCKGRARTYDAPSGHRSHEARGHREAALAG